MPVILITARGEDFEKIMGLDIGNNRLIALFLRISRKHICDIRVVICNQYVLHLQYSFLCFLVFGKIVNRERVLRVLDKSFCLGPELYLKFFLKCIVVLCFVFFFALFSPEGKFVPAYAKEVSETTDDSQAAEAQAEIKLKMAEGLF